MQRFLCNVTNVEQVVKIMLQFVALCFTLYYERGQLLREVERLKTVEAEMTELIVKLVTGEITKGLTIGETKKLIVFLYDLRQDIRHQIADK